MYRLNYTVDRRITRYCKTSKVQRDSRPSGLVGLYVDTNVSKKHNVSIFRVKNQNSYLHRYKLLKSFFIILYVPKYKQKSDKRYMQF
jgi:hypothetical protein